MTEGQAMKMGIHNYFPEKMPAEIRNQLEVFIHH